MNLIEFSMKVNLERFLKKQNRPEFYAVPHPYVGWLAFSTGTGACVGLIYDVFDVDSAVLLYENLTRNHPDCLDVNMPYHQKTDWNFKKAVANYFKWKSILRLSQKEMRHIVAWTKETPKKGTFREYLLDKGYTGYIDNGFGAFTDDLVQRYKDIDWPTGAKGQKKLFIPTWLTPTTLFSVETCNAETPDERYLAYSLDKNLPKGWYGTVSAPICERVSELSTKPGLIWSPYCAPFITQGVQFEPTVTANTFIDVCSTTPDIPFAEPPSETMEKRMMEPEILERLPKLKKGQAERLENVLGVSLMDAWLASRKEHTYLGSRRFLKLKDKYFEICSTGDKELTDFTIDIDHYEIKDDEVFVHLDVVHDGNFFRVTAPHHYLSRGNFAFKMKDLLLRNGVGAVTIDPVYGKILPDLITQFSPNAKVVYLPRTELKKEDEGKSGDKVDVAVVSTTTEALT